MKDLNVFYILFLLPIAKNFLSYLGGKIRENMQGKVKFTFNIAWTALIALVAFTSTKSIGSLIQAILILAFAVLITIVVDKKNKELHIKQDINDVLGFMKFLMGFVAIMVTVILTGLKIIEPVTFWESVSLIVFSYALPIVYATGFSFIDKTIELLEANA